MKRLLLTLAIAALVAFIPIGRDWTVVPLYAAIGNFAVSNNHTNFGADDADGIREFNHTVTVGSDGYIACWVTSTTTDADVIGNPTYGGAAMQLVTGTDARSNTFQYRRWFEKVGPATGLNAFHVEFDVTPTAFALGCVSMTGVDGGAPSSGGAVASGIAETATGGDLAIVCPVGDLAIDGFMSTSGAAPTIDGSQSPNFVPTPGNYAYASSREPSAASPVAMDWSFGSSTWAQSGFCIKTASAGGVASPFSQLFGGIR